MLLKFIVDDELYELNVPEDIVQGAGEFFDQVDQDMNKGWQMGREWVGSPNTEQRCQIVANKLLTALEKENHKVGRLMAGYILNRMPNVKSVEIDTGAELQGITIAAD